MAKRPAMLSEETFRASLQQQGCNPGFADAWVSNCRLYVPLLIAELGEERCAEIVSEGLAKLGIKDSYTPAAVHYIAGWARRAIDDYAAAKTKHPGDTD
jgi:hypothetical protein